MFFLVVLLVSSNLLLAKKGGCAPCLASCCIGPRVGLEMNEGSKLRQSEIYGLILTFLLGVNTNPYVSGWQAFSGDTMKDEREKERLGGVDISAPAPKEKGGCMPAFTSCCLGGRIGLEMNEGRKIRTMEWLMLVPLVNLVPAVVIPLEAYQGKTMSEMAAAEGLDN